jgi:hypothetical protein
LTADLPDLLGHFATILAKSSGDDGGKLSMENWRGNEEEEWEGGGEMAANAE